MDKHSAIRTIVCFGCGEEVTGRFRKKQAFCSRACYDLNGHTITAFGWNGSDEDRFWSKVDKAGPVPVHRPDLGPCWLWTGSPNHNGYGRGYFFGQNMGAHRVSWIINRGKIPFRKQVLHFCDNPPCVNPNHLWVGSQRDNFRDMVTKGRADIRFVPKVDPWDGIDHFIPRYADAFNEARPI